MKLDRSIWRIALFFSWSHCISIAGVLVVISIFGTKIPEPFFIRLRPYLLVGVGFAVLVGLQQYLREKRGFKGSILQAIGSWAIALAIVDIWASVGVIGVRAIVLFTIALILAALSIYLLWARLRPQDDSEDKEFME